MSTPEPYGESFVMHAHPWPSTTPWPGTPLPQEPTTSPTIPPHCADRSLAPGGLLVLEPQQWKSYQNARHKQDLAGVRFARCEQLRLRPGAFTDYLQRQVGFELVAELGVGSELGAVRGFDRPILVLRRPAPGGAHGQA
jgi:hypothetical protein